MKISDTCKNFPSHICAKHVNLVDNLAHEAHEAHEKA